MAPRWSLFAVLMALLLLPPATARAQFSFQTPMTPPGGQAVVRVKAMLELGAAVPGGSTITFGATPVSVPGEVLLPNGDDAKVTVDGNAVVIEYWLYSLLSDPADNCSFNAADPTKNSRTVTFTPSFGGITGYRLTGYSALSAANCSCARRRVKSVGWAAAPPGTNNGRFPMDIALVLDRSGSMSDPTPGDLEPSSKWQALQDSIEQFVDFWATEGLTTSTTTGGVGLSKDRLALIYFQSGVEPISFGDTLYVPRGMTSTPGPTHPWAQISNDVKSKGPAGSTALGGGIAKGVTSWEDLPEPKNDLTVVLMSDGMQNVPPKVKDGMGADIGKKVLEFTPGVETALSKKCRPILTVSMGNAADSFVQDMDTIATQTAGTNRLTTSKGTAAAFAGMLVESLKGNTLSILFQSNAVLPTGTSSASRTVAVDGTARSLYVNLGWYSGAYRKPPLALRVTAPDGSQPTPVANVLGRSHQLVRFDLEKGVKPGDWKLEVIRSGDATTNFPYQLSSYVEEKSLDFLLTLGGKRHWAGQPLELTAQLLFEGKPMKGLEGDLSVQVERPVTAYGTLMHETPTPERKPEQGPDPKSPYQMKLAELLKDPKFLDQIGTKLDATPLKLKEADAGLYTLEYTDTDLPGTYRFHFTLETKDPEGNLLRRVETIEAQVDVQPYGPACELNTQKVDTGVFDIFLTPRDEKGHFVGPGFEDDVLVNIKGEGKVELVDTPKVDGTYRVRLTGVQDDTEIAVFVTGTPVAKGPVTKLEPTKPDDKPVGGGSGTTTPTPNPGPCGCRRTSSAGTMGLMLLGVLGLVSRRRNRQDGE